MTNVRMILPIVELVQQEVLHVLEHAILVEQTEPLQMVIVVHFGLEIWLLVQTQEKTGVGLLFLLHMHVIQEAQEADAIVIVLSLIVVLLVVAYQEQLAIQPMVQIGDVLLDMVLQPLGAGAELNHNGYALVAELSLDHDVICQKVHM